MDLLQELKNIDTDKLTPEKADKINKELVRSVLSEAYADGITDLTYELHPTKSRFVTGRFTDVSEDSGTKTFDYSLEMDSEGAITARYKIDEEDSTDLDTDLDPAEE